jgi:hypothetical protein
MLTGNVEIGNGYGVPGGGAYYAGNLPSAQMSMLPLSKLLTALWYYITPLSMLLAAFSYAN